MNTTPPPDARLKTYQTPKYQTRWTPFSHNTHVPVWIPVPAWRHLLRPITVGRSSLRPGPHRYLLLPRLKRGSRRFLPCPPRLPVPVLVLPLLPWLKLQRRVPAPVKCKKLWQKRSTLQPQGLRPRQQLPNRQPLPHHLVIIPPVIWPSLFALDRDRRPVITRPKYDTLSLSRPQLRGSCAWCLSPGVR